MIKLLTGIFIISALGLMAYPFWGVLDPGSFRAEIAEHYAYHASATETDIHNASYWLLLPNIFLATALLCLSRYLVRPAQRVFAYTAATFTIVVPFSKIYSSAEMGYLLTSSSGNPIYAIEISTEGLVYILLGLVIVAMAKVKAVAT